jgi:hypothetical protein
VRFTFLRLSPGWRESHWCSRDANATTEISSALPSIHIVDRKKVRKVSRVPSSDRVAMRFVEVSLSVTTALQNLTCYTLIPNVAPSKYMPASSKCYWKAIAISIIVMHNELVY